MRAVRTKNDLEGWYHHLHDSVHKANLPFNLLVYLLRREAQDVKITAPLFSDGKVTRLQRKTYRTIQSKVFVTWDRFANDSLNDKQLLSECKYIISLRAPAQVSL